MTKFSKGETVVSIHTGWKVIVTGPGPEPGTFAGKQTGKPERFCINWNAWCESAFQAVQNPAG